MRQVTHGDRCTFSSEVNERHYYRVQGPTFLIEYNNTQNNANHVHSMWRNLGGDFAIPLK